eukprot:1061110-Alexandrium_andersonii.AAC.1
MLILRVVDLETLDYADGGARLASLGPVCEKGDVALFGEGLCAAGHPEGLAAGRHVAVACAAGGPSNTCARGPLAIEL